MSFFNIEMFTKKYDSGPLSYFIMIIFSEEIPLFECPSELYNYFRIDPKIQTRLNRICFI